MRKRAVQKTIRLSAAALAYAAAYAAVHQLSALWATGDFYSIWFPPAGVRFTALWLLGPRVAPLLAVAEVAALASIGVLTRSDLATPLMIGSIVSPCLAYGVAIAIASRLRANSSTLRPTTLRFGIAATLAPLLAFVSSVPWHIAGKQPGFADSSATILAQGIIFTIGDLLGILLLAPPLLGLIELLRERRWPELGSIRSWAGTAAILATGGLLVLLIEWAGFGIRMLPMIIAAGVIGIMSGTLAAWSAVIATSAAVLWLTSKSGFDASELALHLQLAAVVIMGIVAGAYSDDQRKLRDELHARDSALLHAERLKSLRAMSLAVIHELSQPLSTLSIETNYLAELSKSPTNNPDELRTVAELIARKTEHLSNMLRRLRTFGAAPGEDEVSIEVEKLVRDVVAIIAPEARAAGVRIEMRLEKDAEVRGQEIELQQALLNLLRNAIAASPGGTVRLVAEAREYLVHIDIINTPSADSPYRKGMGVGKLIVEAIAEMHGGELEERQSVGGEHTMRLTLPTPIATEA